MLFDTFDRTGDAEFPFPKSVVFRALCAAVDENSRMTVESRDNLATCLHIKTGISALSWGERISVSVRASGPETAIISVQSGAKTIFGSSTSHSKNNQNVREILARTSDILGRHGDAWRAEMPPVAKTGGQSLADELSKLVTLRDQGVLSVEEFDIQKQRLLKA